MQTKPFESIAAISTLVVAILACSHLKINYSHNTKFQEHEKANF